MDGSSFVGLGAGAALCGKAFMVSAGMSEDEFHAKVAACLEEEDAAMNTYFSALVASWEYDRFLALVGAEQEVYVWSKLGQN